MQDEIIVKSGYPNPFTLDRWMIFARRCETVTQYCDIKTHDRNGRRMTDEEAMNAARYVFYTIMERHTASGVEYLDGSTMTPYPLPTYEDLRYREIPHRWSQP